MTNSADLPLWYARVATPLEARGLIPQQGHGRQVTAYGRARSRAAFARMLIAAKLSGSSETATSNWIREYGGETAEPKALAAITDDRVYLAPLDHNGERFEPWPPASAFRFRNEETR